MNNTYQHRDKTKKLKPGLVIVLLLVLFSLLPGEEFDIIRLTDRVLILEQGPWKENMVAVDAGSELIVVDTWSSPVAAAKARDAIAKHFKKPVTYVINTHHHFDHTFGNQVFKGAVIIGHKYCVEDMKADYGDEKTRLTYFQKAIEEMRDPSLKVFYKQIISDIKSDFHLTPPTRTVEETETLRIGNLTVKLYHVMGLHTRSNLTVYIPELGLVFTRREFHHDFQPVLEAGADLPAMIRSLEDILASGIPVKYIIVGHGKPLADPDLKVPLNYLQKELRPPRGAGSLRRPLGPSRGLLIGRPQLVRDNGARRENSTPCLSV